MPLWRRKNSPNLWVRGSVAGEKYRLSSGTADPRKAEEFEDAHRQRLWRKRKLGDRGAISVREAANRWLKTLRNKTREQDRTCLEWLISVGKIAVSSVSDITVEVNEELQQTLLTAGKSAGTVDRYLSCWRRFLRKCALEWHYLDVAPKVPMLNEKSGEPRYLTPQEFRRLYAELPQNLKPAALFAVHTGLRMRAMLSLKWRNVDLKRRRAWIEAMYMKSGHTHGFPLSTEALRALRLAREFRESQEQEHLAWCRRHHVAPMVGDTEHVFTYRRKPIDDCNTAAFQRALRAAGIQGTDWHTLRHTFASWAVQGGVPLPELMKLGPWESYEMVLRYAHLATDSLSSAVSRVAQIGHTGQKRKSSSVSKNTLKSAR